MFYTFEENVYFDNCGWNKFVFDKFQEQFENKLNQRSTILKIKEGRYKDIPYKTKININTIKDICLDEYNCISEVRKLNFLEYLVNKFLDIDIMLLILEVLYFSKNICDDKNYLFDGYLKYGCLLFGKEKFHERINQNEKIKLYLAKHNKK